MQPSVPPILINPTRQTTASHHKACHPYLPIPLPSHNRTYLPPLPTPPTPAPIPPPRHLHTHPPRRQPDPLPLLVLKPHPGVIPLQQRGVDALRAHIEDELFGFLALAQRGGRVCVCGCGGAEAVAEALAQRRRGRG